MLLASVAGVATRQISGTAGVEKFALGRSAPAGVYSTARTGFGHKRCLSP